ncbi:hypothetical protein, partial [Hymenobacter agri]
MPENQSTKRTIRATVARAPRTIHAGSYTAGTTPQLHGRASNKTLQYLADMEPTDAGQQAFWREALTGIPHPLDANQTLNYGQLQDLVHGPQGAAAVDAYAAANKLTARPAAATYQQAMFDQAKARLLVRAAEKPGEYAFPASADAARRAPNTARAIAHGDYVQPEAMQNAASL